MKQTKQATETLRSLQQKLSKYEREIQLLTYRIAMHREKKMQIMLDGTRFPMNRKKLNEWRRLSFALHRKRSDLKEARDLLIKNISLLPHDRALAARKNDTVNSDLFVFSQNALSEIGSILLNPIEPSPEDHWMTGTSDSKFRNESAVGAL
ncbi:MAG: hypothetical protein KJ737_16725 [Proteobacteria bacterium]|nr:hypothetical protein [Pseudomonadota bacterium]